MVVCTRIEAVGGIELIPARIWRSCSGVMTRHANCCSILTRAIASSSARFLSPSASFRSCAASLLARAASPSAMLTNWRDASLIRVSTWLARMWTSNSPHTPATTSATPASSKINFHRWGFSGELRGEDFPSMNSLNVFRSRAYSTATTISSKATPTITRTDQKLSQESSADQGFSNLPSSLERANASIERFQWHELRVLRLQLVAIVGLCVGFIVYVLCLQLLDSSYFSHRRVQAPRKKA